MDNFFEAHFNPVFDTQQVFRVIMDSMARPGKINRIPISAKATPEGLSPCVAAICMTLLDSETGFYAGKEAWQEYLRVNTGSVMKPAAEADFVIIDGRETGFDPVCLRRGTLLFPDLGATLIISVEDIETPAGEGLNIRMTGPGIPDFRVIRVKGLDPFYLKKIASLNEEYPLGVDTIMVDQSGSLVCMSRSTHFEWEGAARWGM